MSPATVHFSLTGKDSFYPRSSGLPGRAAELVLRAGSGVPKAVLARDYGISRETVNQYLHDTKLG